MIVLGREDKCITVRELVGKADTNSSSIKRALEELAKLKLIKCEKEKAFPYRRLIALREVWMEIAKRVIEIEELVKKVQSDD